MLFGKRQRMGKESKTNIAIIGSYKQENVDMAAAIAAACLNFDRKTLKMIAVDPDITVCDENSARTALGTYLSEARGKEELAHFFLYMSTLVGVKIDGYVFLDIAEAVAAVGGVDLKLGAGELRALDMDAEAVGADGTARLLPLPAVRFLTYSEEAMGTDRLDRQYRFLHAVRKKIKKLDLKLVYNLFVNMMPTVKTNMKKREIMKLSFRLIQQNHISIEKTKLTKWQ